MSTPTLCQVCNSAVATHQCICQSPWPFLCLPCYPQHSSCPGNHFKLPIPITPAPASTRLCESCRLNTAEKKVGETWLCEGCAQVFEATSTFKAPVSIGFEDIKTILLEQIQTAKSAISTVKGTFDGLIKELYRQKLQIIEKLHREIAELEGIVNNYIANPTADTYISKLATGTPNPDIDIREELQLLRYQSDIEEIRLKIPSIFTYSLSNYLFQADYQPIPDFSPPILPVFRKINTVFFLPRCASSPIQTNLLPLQDCTSWLFVTDEHLFLCGEPRKPAAYILTISGFAYNPTAPSIYRRDHPCLGRFGDFLYLFGGDFNETPQKYCESYSLSQDKWNCLPNMQFSRSYSLPCLYKEAFYLLGGKWTSTAEMFDPVKGRFRTLTLELPFHGFNFSVVYDQDIYYFSQGRVLTWEIKMGAQYLNEILDMSEDIYYYADTGNPLRVGDEVFFFGENLKEKQKSLYSFDLSTKKFEIKAKVPAQNALFRS